MNLFKKKSPLDNYISEVRSYLPRKNREDILEELRANLEERLADRCEESAETLDDAAIIKILSEFGHPLRIAAEYQGGNRSLIGPTLYPFYRMSIMVSMFISTCILIVFLFAQALYDIDLGEVNRPWMFVNTYIYIVGIITVGYFTAERLMERNNYLDSWQPKALKQTNDVLVSVRGSIFSVIAATTWLIILNMPNMDHSLGVLFGQEDNPIHTLVFWMKIQMVVLIPQYFYLVFNQAWSRNRLILRGSTEMLLSIGCVVVLFTNADQLLLGLPQFPERFASAFVFVVWALLLASIGSSLVFWRKLAAATTASSE